MADTTIKKWNDTTNQWEELYPETTVSQLIATGDRDSTTFLRGDGVFSDTLTGTLTVGGLTGSNYNITGVNELQINDPGEGIKFRQGSSGDMILAIVDDSNDNILRFSGTNAELQVNSDTVWHNGIFEPIVDNLDVLPTYGASNEDFIKYNTTERAIEVQSSTDDNFGAVYPALKTESGVSWKISFSIKASASASSGVYFRIQEYDGALPDGKTHTAANATHSEVQTATRQRSSFHENQAIGTDWEQHSFFYTPTSTTSWFSPLFLNWTGLGTNSLFIKNLRIFAIQEDSADANTLDGIDSTQFVRSDASDTMAGDYRIESGSFASLILDRGTTGSGSVVQFENNNGIIGGIGAFGDDGLQFRTKDGTQMVLSSADRLGIGTQSPASKLDVDGNVRFYRSGQSALQTYSAKAGLELSGYQSTSGSPYTKTSDIVANADGTVASQMRFFTKASGSSSPSERLRITSAGNVGIGDTSPQGKLTVEQAMTNGGSAFSAPHLALNASNTVDSTGFVGMTLATSTADNYGWSYGAQRTSSGIGNLYWRNHSGTSAGNDRMMLTSGGNLGIGTTSPGRQLEVNGEGVLRLDSTSGDPGIDFQTAGTQDMQFRYRASSDYLGIYSYGTTTDVMSIKKSNGYVGIGTTSPSYGLDVHADGGQIRAYGTTAKVWAEASDNGQASLELKNTEGHLRFITDNGAFQLYDQIDGASRFEIDTNGHSKFFGNLTIQTNFPRIYLTDTDHNSDYSIINANGQFSIYDDTNSEYRMAIEADGKVGFGTGSPLTKMHIVESGTSTALTVQNASSNGTVMKLATTGDSRNLYLQSDHIYSNGNLYFGDNSYETIIRGSVVKYDTPNLYLNNNNSPTDTDTTIYFGDDQSDTAHYMQFDDSSQLFKFSDDIYALGHVYADNHVYAKGEIRINYDNTGDAILRFGDAASDTAHYMSFSNAAQQYYLSDTLNLYGGVKLDHNGTGTVDSHAITFTSQFNNTDVVRELKTNSSGELLFNGNELATESYVDTAVSGAGGGVTSIKNFTNYVASSGTTEKNLPVTKTLSTGDKIGLVVQTGTTSNYGTRSQEIIWVEVGTSSHTVQTSYYATATTTARWYAFEVYINSSGALYIDDAVAWTNGSFGHSGSNSSAIYILDVLELT